MSTKTCTKCHETKPLDEFGRHRRKKDGRRARCKECEREDGRKYYADNREAERARYNRWAAANPEKIVAKDHAYRRANRERLNAESRAYHHEHRSQIAERKRRWRGVNPHLAWANYYRRRVEHYGLDDFLVEDFTKPDVIARYGDSCFYCGGEFQELDHYVPISANGPHTLDNVRPSCRRCNRDKSSRHGDEYLERVAQGLARRAQARHPSRRAAA